MVELKELQKFLMEKGIIFPTAEIYGGFSGFPDYGPLGVEMKRAVKDVWWNRFVREREDIVGMDGSIITHPKVWEASGHVGAFYDPLVECKKCGNRFRADHVIEDKLGINADGVPLEKMEKLIAEKGIKCQKCGGELGKPKEFGLMFSTQVGPVEGGTSYLRPETAQSIFVNFFRIYRTSRKNLPFGIAQIGRAFRNEISPRNFPFRSREFEQMEIEYFINPEKKCPLIDEVKHVRMNILTRDAQEKNQEPVEMGTADMLKITGDWHVYWLAKFWEFFMDLGIKPENLRLRQHTKDELSFYSKDTWDYDYNYPFGWKELMGLADRTDYDLKQHAKSTDKELKVLEDGKKIFPAVIEPSAGVDRLVLTLLVDAWHMDGERHVLRLSPLVSPNQVAVFPLVNKDGMDSKAREIYGSLKTRFRTFYDDRGSIGRRYRRQDSLGTPWCVTVDGDTLKDGTVTMRNRDSMEQRRVKIEEIEKEMSKSF